MSPELAQIKLELLKKYTRKSKITKSKPSRSHYAYKANKYRIQLIKAGFKDLVAGKV